MAFNVHLFDPTNTINRVFFCFFFLSYHHIHKCWIAIVGFNTSISLDLFFLSKMIFIVFNELFMMFEYFICLGWKLQWDFGAWGMWNTRTQLELVIRGKIMFSCHIHVSLFFVFCFRSFALECIASWFWCVCNLHIFFPPYYYLPHISKEKLRFQSVSHCATNCGVGDGDENQREKFYLLFIKPISIHNSNRKNDSGQIESF